MAMTSCSECGNKISTSARSCPKCGAIVPVPRLWPWIVSIPIVLLAVSVIHSFTRPEYEIRARELLKVCEEVFPFQKNECRRSYDRAIAEGKAKGDK